MINKKETGMADEFDPTEACALRLDAEDPLRDFRRRFFIPPGKIYMDGNSLGLMSADAEISVKRVLQEWKQRGIDGWLEGEPPWFYFAERLGTQCAPLVGAADDEVAATGTTTVNIHSLVATFYKPEGRRTRILADELNFPTDIYALKGQIKLKGLDPAEELILVKSADGKTLDEETIIGNMTDRVALILLPSVLYRSGQLLDIPYLTRKAHEKGIIIGFDCSHSVGAVPHYFDDWEVDFALWCSYKYLNSGPGSPAFLYVNRRHFPREPLLAGWFGFVKEKQFHMLLDFEHARSASGWQISSPGIINAAPVEGALRITLEAGIEGIRKKSLLLTDYLVYLVDTLLSAPPYSFRIGTPRRPQHRGGHIALERDLYAWEICRALKVNKGVIPDFRAPDVIRVAPVALYNTFQEVRQVVLYLKDIVDSREYEAFRGERPPIT